MTAKEYLEALQVLSYWGRILLILSVGVPLIVGLKSILKYFKNISKNT